MKHRTFSLTLFWAYLFFAKRCPAQFPTKSYPTPAPRPSAPPPTPRATASRSESSTPPRNSQPRQSAPAQNKREERSERTQSKRAHTDAPSPNESNSRNKSYRTKPADSSTSSINTARSAPTATRDSELHGRKSNSLLKQFNTRRTGLTGVNGRPLPKGDITLHPGGAFSLKTRTGSHYEVRADGTVGSFHTGNQSASFFSNGHLASAHTAGLDIRSGPHGEHTIVARRPDGTVLVSTGPHTGYLETHISSATHGDLLQRTYVSNGLLQTRVFTSYRYYGVSLPYYVPSAYFAPAFYGWTFYPWTPLSFNWSWAQRPGSPPAAATSRPTVSIRAALPGSPTTIFPTY